MCNDASHQRKTPFGPTLINRMGILKRFFRNVFREGSLPLIANGHDRIPMIERESHLTVDRYGGFRLTDAVRPSFDLRIVPKQGYRHDRYRDEQNRMFVPVLMAAVSKEQLFETFLDLLDPLGNVVDVVLETSHRRCSGEHSDLYREQIDLPILKSYLYEFEEMLLNDGCTCIAMLNPSIPMEVQFDEHKMLIIYAEKLSAVERILRNRGVVCDERIRFLTEAEHIHSTRDEFIDLFQHFQTTLGIDEECWTIC